MAGGVGSRLWPLSRKAYPKQYLSLIHSNDNTMLQETFIRLETLDLNKGQLICNEEHRFLAAEQCRKININTEIILEPFGRNTAPAVIISALRFLDEGNDDPMLILSADHQITDNASFIEAIKDAYNSAVSGNIVIIGIQPTFACTGYGYIHLGDKTTPGFKVKEFIEKPEQILANSYFNSGSYLWNSGIFIVKPSVLVNEARAHCQELLDICRFVNKSSKIDNDFIRLSEEDFSKCQNISLDYAIMEHTNKAVVLPLECGWSDLGDLQALWSANEKDDNGNVLKGDVITEDSYNCIVRAENKLVTILGIEGVGVFETKDAILVASLDKSQQVKNIVTKLEGREELTYQREVYRPWGSYDSIDFGENYQVKRISVKPGAKLSLQKHKYRAEHWVVVRGEATVHLDGDEQTLKTNDSIYIPLGSIHSLANNTNEILDLIEVQSGSYLGEDDIERFEDLYGRC